MTDIVGTRQKEIARIEAEDSVKDPSSEAIHNYQATRHVMITQQ